MEGQLSLVAMAFLLNCLGETIQYRDMFKYIGMENDKINLWKTPNFYVYQDKVYINLIKKFKKLINYRK